jgi:hypothetical protein
VTAPSGAKAPLFSEPVIAALKRCATQKREGLRYAEALLLPKSKALRHPKSNTALTKSKTALSFVANCRAPQGLKPASLLALDGTTEVVPFPNRFYEIASNR